MPPPLQISIPQTSTGSSGPGSKTYTIYHIRLTLPLRDHVLQKRYSDFTALHASLTEQAGSAPPAPLPPKAWLRSTISSAAVTSERRAGLESYLRSIIDSDDPRWRQSSAWRTFLALPTTLTTPVTTEETSALDPSAWLSLHREVKSHLHTARLALRKRDAAPTVADQHASSAEAKASLVKAATAIARCDSALQTPGSELGDRELRRRKDLLFAVRAETEALETQMRALPPPTTTDATSSAAATQADKERLWAGVKPGGRVLGGPAKETERTREVDNTGVLQLQRDIMEEQDEDVLELGKAVSRMKEMGIRINEELVVQNKMLDLLDGDVDRVQSKLDVGKKRIAKIH